MMLLILSNLEPSFIRTAKLCCKGPSKSACGMHTFPVASSTIQQYSAWLCEQATSAAQDQDAGWFQSILHFFANHDEELHSQQQSVQQLHGEKRMLQQQLDQLKRENALLQSGKECLQQQLETVSQQLPKQVLAVLVPWAVSMLTVSNKAVVSMQLCLHV